MSTNSKEYEKTRRERLPRIAFEVPFEVKERLGRWGAEHNMSYADIGRKALINFMNENKIRLSD